MRVVEESEYGLYVWQMPDGRWVGDDEGRYLNMPGKKNDLLVLMSMRKAVNSYGIFEGEAKFLSNRRQVTDMEYDDQNERLRDGLLPDPYDYAALEDEAESIKRYE